MATNTEPQWWQKQLEAQEKSGYIYQPGFGAVPEKVSVRKEQPNAITLRSGSEDMIKCSPEGFWVRGVKVAQDDKEAESVYNAFKQWLTWASLNDTK